MFRDSRGVVHTVSSTDPLRDLPGDTAAALARALLRPVDGDLDSALERCEAVRELVERWQDAFFAALPDEVDLAEEARWAAEAGLSLSDVEDQYEGDDELDGDDELEQEVALDAIDLRDVSDPVGLLDPDEVDDDPDDPRAVLPEDLVSLLERELLLLPVRVRLEALVAAADLVEGWSDLLADHEKLLGHLVLAHDEQQEPHSHTRLADRHAQLHAAQGPGHADQDD